MKTKKYRKGIFAVVYSIEKKKIYYALLKRKHHWKGWEFTKGKIEKNETKERAAKREAIEETGLKFVKMKCFGVCGDYKYKKILADRPNIVGQTYFLYAIEAKKGKIKVDEKEHYFGKWFEFDDAVKKLTWANQRKCLRIVNGFLINCFFFIPYVKS